jgi:hypothetical protein
MTVKCFDGVKNTVDGRGDRCDLVRSSTAGNETKRRCKKDYAIHCGHPFAERAASRTKAALASVNIGPVREENDLLPLEDRCAQSVKCSPSIQLPVGQDT